MGNIAKEDEVVEGALELDIHADSPVVGKCARVLHRTGRTVLVSGFTDKLGKPDQVVHAGVIHECIQSGKKFLMILRYALHIPEMDVCLIHPIMMRLIGIKVDECPKFLSPHPSADNHSIYFPK